MLSLPRFAYCLFFVKALLVFNEIPYQFISEYFDGFLRFFSCSEIYHIMQSDTMKIVYIQFFKTITVYDTPLVFAVIFPIFYRNRLVV